VTLELNISSRVRRALQAAALVVAVSALPATIAVAAPFQRDLQLGVGKSVIVDLPEDASEIYVGDPKVANAIVRSARRLYVTATGNGQTSIFAMGPDGQKLAVIDVSVGRDINVLAQLINAAVPNNDVHVRTVADNIILTGSVASAGDMAKVMDIATGFLSSAPPAAQAANQGAVAATGVAGGAGGPPAQAGGAINPTTASSSPKIVNAMTIRGLDQVAVKVTVAEIRRDIVKQLGIDSSGSSGQAGTSAFNIINPFPINGLISGATGNLGWISGGNSLTATLRAFERQGVSHTLAEPVITSVSGESAKFLAGGTIPIATSETCTGSSFGCTIGYQQQPYGVTLNFTPVVLSEGRIQMRVATEVTDVDFSTEISVGGASVPGFKTRRNETTVELPSGGSMATAGLISTQTAQGVDGVPGLLNLPVLGALFRSHDYKRAETELMIVVTPYIVHPIDPKQYVRPDAGFHEATDPQAWILGRVNRIYSTDPATAPTFAGRVGFIAN
jgi:pilus assembly protein CpaC